MRSTSTALIVNPAAGGGRCGRHWADLARRIRRCLGDCPTFFTRPDRRGDGCARYAARQGLRRLVCVGGDGTFHEVVNGVMGLTARMRNDLRVGLIPMGSGCDFIRSAAIPMDTRAALATVRRGHTRRVDVVRLVLRGPDGGWRRRYVVNMASAGAGGAVVRRVNRRRRPLAPRLAFLGATLRTPPTLSPVSLHLVVDGRRRACGPVWHLALANGRYQGGGMCLAPEARLGDGRLQVVQVGAMPLSAVLRHLPKLYTGRIREVPRVTLLSARRVEVVTDRPVWVDADGELAGRTPLAAEVVPAGLRVIVPERGAV